MTHLEYTDKVLDYLEHIGYPDYITLYKPEDVALAMARTMVTFHKSNLSYRMCALVIFGLTWWKISRNVNIEHHEVWH